MIDKDILKLAKLCEHWANHNESHKENYEKWRKIAQEKGLESIANKLNQAIEMMDKSTQFLLSAKEELS
ncbi:MAG: hypothetical protein EAX89_13710 [Candidatus Lokiarchaeota archaeon]|nr:hypothetical protein [Candidatus Lokiarchaeota archaeon]